MPRHQLPPGPGRPKGSRNKAPLEIQKLIHEALDRAGGADYLLRQSEENPVAFMGLLSKVIPKDVNLRAEVAGVITIARSFVKEK